MSYGEAQEIRFDQYFQKDDQDDDDFEDSDNFSVHHNNTSSPKKPPVTQAQKSVTNYQPSFGSNNNKPAAAGKALGGLGQGNIQNKQQTKSKAPVFEEDSYDDFEEESKHSNEIKIGGTKGLNNHQQDDFEVDEDDEKSGGGFDNAFKYDKDEFKSDVSDSNDNVIPVSQINKNDNDFGNFSIKREENPFATKKNLNNNQPIVTQQKQQPLQQTQLKLSQQQPKPTHKINSQLQNQQSFGGDSTPMFHKMQSQAQEIKFAPVKDNIQTDSDIGFDEDIEEDHFSEQPIDDDFQESKKSDKKPLQQQNTNNNQTKNFGTLGTNMMTNNKDNASIVNMASVVPNPKIVSITQTKTLNNNQITSNQGNNMTNANDQKKGVQTKNTLNPFAQADIQEDQNEQSNIYPEFEYEQEDSMDDIHKKINAIPSRFSDIGSPNVQNNANIQQQKKVIGNPTNQSQNTKAKVIGNKSSVKQQQPSSIDNIQSKSTATGGRQASKPRPQTAKVKQQDQGTTNNNKRTGSKAPLPKIKQRNNNDIEAVMQDNDNIEEVKQGNDQDDGDLVNQGSLAEKVTKNLLQSRMKSNRIVLRPESAKPKVGYEGNPNVLGKVKPLSANHNDLTAQLAQSKKFQMLKKLKQEKERKQEMTVRNLKKANVIKEKQKQAKEQQQQQQQQSQNQQDNKPLFKDEFEGDDFFEEAEEIKGDQAVGPGGNGGMNDDLNNNNNDLQDTLNQSVRQSVKDLAVGRMMPDKQKPPISTTQNQAQNNSSNTQTQQANNQGGTGLMNNLLNKSKVVANQTPQSLALQKQKEQDAEQKNNASKVLGKTDERFNEILRQKKDKEVNKDVLGFMMEKNLRNQQEKQQALENQVNRLAKDFNLKDVPKSSEAAAQNKGSDKVPEHAKLVVDDEKLSKELMDLKRRFKETNLENLKVSSNIELVENKKREKEALFDKIMNDKNLIKINGTLKMQGEGGSKNSTSLLYGIKLEDIPDFDKIAKERVNPLESVVKKIENKGMTLEQAFNLFDDDGDEVLTIQEIKNGIKLQGIDLLDTEMLDLIKAIDANSDGVLTLEEWLNTLNPKFDAEKEFRQIMQNIDIDDPLVLEERILDLRFRSQRLERELEIMRETSGDEQGFNYKDRVRRQMKNPLQKKFADKILNLEERLNSKISNILFEKIQIENRIKQSLMAKDDVHQDFYEAQRVKERIDTEYSMRLQSIQDNLNILDHKLNDLTQHTLMIKGDREYMKTQISRMQVKITSMTEMESKLDKQLEQILGKAIDGKDLEMLYELDMKILRQLNSGSNQKFNGFLNYLACVQIQRIFRGYIGRRDAKIFKFQRERLARRLQPIVRAKFHKKQIWAASLIQRIFRRFKSRKQQLEALRKKNQMKKLLEEEEDRNYKSHAQLMEAARTIYRYWKDYKRKQMRDFAMISKMNQRQAFNKTIEVIYIPSVRKCFICKKTNAARLCPSCQDCLYCEECYIEYHARGHRKVHNYKRVRFGVKPYDENEEKQDMQKFIIKQQSFQENSNPNVTQNQNQNHKFNSNQSQNQMINKNATFNTSSNNSQNDPKHIQLSKNEFSFQDQSMDTFTRDTLKNTELNAKVNKDELVFKEKPQDQSQKSGTTVRSTKSVRLSDEGFLRSFKQPGQDLVADLGFFNNDDLDNNEYMNLSDFKDALLQNEKIFKVSPEDVERLCEIANDKCQIQNPRDDGDIRAYVDLRKLQQLIQA